MERQSLEAFDFCLQDGRPRGSLEDSLGGSEASSPEDETPNSFHTPQHDSLPRCKGAFPHLGSGSPSQDSMEIYLDAPSPLNSPHLRMNGQVMKGIVSNGELRNTKRKRHASFEHKPSFLVEKKEDDWEDADENTCMLQNGLHKQRVRRWSCGQGSRSCSSSPFHVTHFSLSTNSLKKNIERTFAHSPKKFCHGMSDSASATGYVPVSGTGYVPCTEVNMIVEEKVPQPPKEEGPKNMTYVKDTGRTPTWVKNYVACVENNYTNGGVPNEFKINTISLENHWKDEGFSTPLPLLERKKGCCQFLKGELKASNLRLNHKSPHLFVTSQWQHHGKMSCFHLGYRLFWMVYFLMWGIWSFVGANGYHSPLAEKWVYFILFPHWGLWILIMDTFLQAVNVVLHMKKIASEGNAKYSSMTTRMKLSWALSNIASAITLLNALLHWTLNFKHLEDPISEITVNVHIIPCLYVFGDTLLSATPRRLLHAYFPMFFAGIYGTFSLVYFLLGGKNAEGEAAIYRLLDWRKAGHTLVTCIFILLVLIPLLHFVLCIFAQCRIMIWRTLNVSRGEKSLSKKKVTREENV